MKLLVWNIEWGTPRSRRGRHIQGLIAKCDADLVCVTEGSAGMLPASGEVIDAGDDYGYGDTGQRRKVLLWSRTSWTDVDREGDEGMPAGRFVAGTTAGLRILGVCTPWRDAHVRTGRRDRAAWQDHRAYLEGLARVVRKTPTPAIVVGDFNQRIPRRGQPKDVYDALFRALGPSLHVLTEGVRDDEDKQLIDHVAASHGLKGRVVETIPRRTPHGLRLSDHVGIVAELEPA